MIISLRKVVGIIISILIPLGIGFISGYITKDAMATYENLIKPSFAPPGYIFPIVWTVLYILMGIASYRIYKLGIEKKEVKNALFFYGVQLMLNFLWPILYFGLGLRFVAFIEIIVLFIFIVITTKKFFKLDKIAGYFMVPYLLWVAFASVLNYFTWRLNK